MRAKQQSGFIMMVFVVILVLGASAYFSGYGENLFFKQKAKLTLENYEDTQIVKSQFWRYSVFQPEFYESDPAGGTGFNLKNIDRIPGPGYFPCVDLDGDGEVLGAETSCGNVTVAGDDTTGFVVGFLPTNFRTRNIFFNKVAPKEFYYILDERFANGNNSYNNGSTGRFAPLNPGLSPTGRLFLNDQDGYVALIIAPGESMVMQDGTIQDRNQAGDALARIADYLDKRFDALGNEVNGNADGDFKFYSQSKSNIGINDTVIGISFSEWQTMMLNRVCAQKTDLEATDANVAFWFNAYDATTNPAGSDWRSFMGNCP
ncbi:hypothetical protein [Thiosulfativibrio zosterae]|uniref:hypothetical protein n=1 Tax=Thiosulfativibrio zosterae TaxID=2675053 RepID=UPI0015674845|nr:hypothetical protein [Thiosulfativibrio zosterae]